MGWCSVPRVSTSDKTRLVRTALLTPVRAGSSPFDIAVATSPPAQNIVAKSERLIRALWQPPERRRNP